MRTKKEGSRDALEVLEELTGGPLTLGEALWSIRMCDEYTQVEFAKKLGISPQHLCDIEKGRKLVSPSLAAEYAEKLSDSVEQFIRLAIQDDLRRAGLDYEVDIRKAA